MNKMEKIKHIAVAVDFSANSRVAYKYGQALATLLNADLQLIHIYSSPNMLMTEAEIVNDVAYKNTAKQLRRFANNKLIEGKIYIGSPSKKLTELSKERVFDLLIVGVSGERGLFDKLLGSVSMNLTKHAYCPVLLTPQKAKIPVAISNIVYATSELSTDKDGIATMTDWAQATHAKLHFVHVNRPGFGDKTTDIEALLTNSKVEYAVKELDYVTVRGAIDNYCEAHSADMVVAMTQNYSFFGGFFHDSVTESLAWNMNVPLLVLHKMYDV
jgi:nucleotide-binding universal stress UspA family protein